MLDKVAERARQLRREHTRLRPARHPLPQLVPAILVAKGVVGSVQCAAIVPLLLPVFHVCVGKHVLPHAQATT